MKVSMFTHVEAFSEALLNANASKYGYIVAPSSDCLFVVGE